VLLLYERQNADERAQELLTLSEGDIRELGVRNGAHRARLVSSLVMLREAQLRQGKSSLTTLIFRAAPHSHCQRQGYRKRIARQHSS